MEMSFGLRGISIDTFLSNFSSFEVVFKAIKKKKKHSTRINSLTYVYIAFAPN